MFNWETNIHFPFSKSSIPLKALSKYSTIFYLFICSNLQYLATFFLNSFNFLLSALNIYIIVKILVFWLMDRFLLRLKNIFNNLILRIANLMHWFIFIICNIPTFPLVSRRFSQPGFGSSGGAGDEINRKGYLIS